jgi:hypothetical protein
VCNVLFCADKQITQTAPCAVLCLRDVRRPGGAPVGRSRELSGSTSQTSSRRDSEVDDSVLHIPEARSLERRHASGSPKRPNKRKRGNGWGRMGQPDTRWSGGGGGGGARVAPRPRLGEAAVAETQVMGSSALLPRTVVMVPASLRAVFRCVQFCFGD